MTTHEMRERISKAHTETLAVLGALNESLETDDSGHYQTNLRTFIENAENFLGIATEMLRRLTPSDVR